MNIFSRDTTKNKLNNTLNAILWLFSSFWIDGSEFSILKLIWNSAILEMADNLLLTEESTILRFHCTNIWTNTATVILWHFCNLLSYDVFSTSKESSKPVLNMIPAHECILRHVSLSQSNPISIVNIYWYEIWIEQLFDFWGWEQELSFIESVPQVLWNL